MCFFIIIVVCYIIVWTCYKLIFHSIVGRHCVFPRFWSLKIIWLKNILICVSYAFFFCRKHWGNQLWDRVCITLPLAVNNKQFIQNDSTQYFSTLVLSASPRNLLKVQILIPLSRQLWGGGPAMFVVTSSLCYSDTNSRAVVPSLHSGIILKSQTNKQTNSPIPSSLPPDLLI